MESGGRGAVSPYTTPTYVCNPTSAQGRARLWVLRRQPAFALLPLAIQLGTAAPVEGTAASTAPLPRDSPSRGLASARSLGVQTHTNSNVSSNSGWSSAVLPLWFLCSLEKLASTLENSPASHISNGSRNKNSEKGSLCNVWVLVSPTEIPNPQLIGGNSWREEDKFFPRRTLWSSRRWIGVQIGVGRYHLKLTFVWNVFQNEYLPSLWIGTSWKLAHGFIMQNHLVESVKQISGEKIQVN